MIIRTSFFLMLLAFRCLASDPKVVSVADTGLKGPFGVDLDRAGNLYFVEMTGNRLGKIESGGALKTLDTKLSGPHNLALASDGSIYIAETWSNRVQKFDPKQGATTTFAGTGEKGFSGDGGPASKAKFGGI